MGPHLTCVHCVGVACVYLLRDYPCSKNLYYYMNVPRLPISLMFQCNDAFMSLQFIVRHSRSVGMLILTHGNKKYNRSQITSDSRCSSTHALSLFLTTSSNARMRRLTPNCKKNSKTFCWTVRQKQIIVRCWNFFSQLDKGI